MRKMLVENYFYAVVSLPAGVFNPYSGVKTSILLMDKAIAKQRNEILFVKIDNDGYNLGAQRTAVKGSQLEEAISLTHEFVENGGIAESPIAQLVERNRIAENGDYNLTGDRYLAATDFSLVSFPLTVLDDVIELESGSRQKGGALSEGIPSIGGEQIDTDGKIRFDKMKYISESHFSGMSKGVLQDKDVLVVKDGATTGKTGYYENQFANAAVNEHVYILRAKPNILPFFLYNLVRGEHFQNELQKYVKGIIGGISSEIKSIQIPLPPLSIQEEIVAEIEGYQKIIDGAKAVVANYKPKIDIDPDWAMVDLEHICENISDGDHQPPPKSETGVPFITISNIDKSSKIDFVDTYYVPESYYQEIKPHRKPKVGDILYTVTGSYGISVFIDFKKEFCFQRHIGLIRPKAPIINKYLFYFLQTPDALNQADKLSTGIAQKTVSLKSLRKFQIPVPPIETQHQIVAQIEKEQALVNSNKQLIEIFEQKIKDRIAKVWGE